MKASHLSKGFARKHWQELQIHVTRSYSDCVWCYNSV